VAVRQRETLSGVSWSGRTSLCNEQKHVECSRLMVASDGTLHVFNQSRSNTSLYPAFMPRITSWLTLKLKWFYKNTMSYDSHYARPEARTTVTYPRDSVPKQAEKRTGWEWTNLGSPGKWLQNGDEVLCCVNGCRREQVCTWWFVHCSWDWWHNWRFSGWLVKKTSSLSSDRRCRFCKLWWLFVDHI